MGLSAKAVYALEVGLTKVPGSEVVDAINVTTERVAATVAALPASADLVAPGTLAAAAPLAGTETRLDANEAKINQIIAALKAAGLML